MIIEGEYFYKGALRLSWGFGSPNQLGAFVAAALPVIWAMSAAIPIAQPSVPRSSAGRHQAWSLGGRAALGLLELGLWLTIGATASRGAAVAALAKTSFGGARASAYASGISKVNPWVALFAGYTSGIISTENYAKTNRDYRLLEQMQEETLNRFMKQSDTYGRSATNLLERWKHMGCDKL